ncbi:hypothetical protein BJY52DRAFT_1195311 [Lactarius psammicola]|nr:hypothetical protein BJY52DRAFT_1195311 [Lactarius psammicola]
MIPRSDDDPTHVVEPYIFYHDNNQQVVGCMGRNQPPYAESVLLQPADPPIRLPIPISDSRLAQFQREHPRAYAIDEVIQDLGDPCIKAEVSRLRDTLHKQTTLQKQREDVEKQLLQLQRAQFDTDLEINAIRKRMEKADVPCTHSVPARKFPNLPSAPTAPSNTPAFTTVPTAVTTHVGIVDKRAIKSPIALNAARNTAGGATAINIGVWSAYSVG